MKYVIFSLLFFSTIVNSYSQDVIVKRDGTEIKSKVLEINNEVIKYKEFNFQDGPTRNINISDVFMIIYANGKREKFVTDGNPSIKEDKSKGKKHKQVKEKTSFDRKGFSFLVEANPLFYLFFIPSSKYHYYTKDIQNIKFDFTDNITFSPRFCFEGGLYTKYYFNDLIGVKTGIGVSYYKFSANLMSSFYSEDDRYNGGGGVNADMDMTYINIPLGMVITTGDKIGLNVEFGFSTKINISSNDEETSWTYLTDTYTDETAYDNNKNRVVIDSYINTTINSFITVGITIPFSEKVRINGGPFANINLNNAFSSPSENLPDKILSLGFIVQLEIK